MKEINNSMNNFIKTLIPTLQVPAPGHTAAALRVEVVKEQALGRLLPQRVERSQQRDGSAISANSKPSDSQESKTS
jgi:hypothetical protein